MIRSIFKIRKKLKLTFRLILSVSAFVLSVIFLNFKLNGNTLI